MFLPRETLAPLRPPKLLILPAALSLDPVKTKGISSLAEAQKAGAVIAYGDFITNVVDFIIIAFFIFMLVKGINGLKRSVSLQAEAAAAATPPVPPEPTREEKVLVEIPDLLKART